MSAERKQNGEFDPARYDSAEQAGVMASFTLTGPKFEFTPDEIAEYVERRIDPSNRDCDQEILAGVLTGDRREAFIQQQLPHLAARIRQRINSA